MKAHIIPRAFFRDLSDDDGGIPIQFSTTPRVRPRRAPTGIYDSAIVCESCERRFDPWDAYGVRFLRRDRSTFALVQRVPNAEEIETHDFDYARLKLFCLSVLWRAHASTQPLYRAVDLGPFEPRLRAMILAADAGGKDDFPVWMTRYYSPNRPVVLQPIRKRVDGINGYLFHFALHDIVCVVDRQRPTCESFKRIALDPNRPFRVIVVPFIGGPKHKQLKRTFTTIEGLKGTWQRPHERSKQ